MIYINLPSPFTKEGSSFVAKAYFRSGTAASTPTSARYRVDCLTTGKSLTDWTSLTPAAVINITVTSTDNAIQDQGNRVEIKQITVEENTGTSQTRDTQQWEVRNIRGF